MPSLDELESRLQTLLEVQFLKYLPGYKAEDRIYQQLATAMHNSLKELNGTTFAPNVFVIIANPSTVARLHTEPQLVKDLADALQTAGKEAGFYFLTSPNVSTAADTDMNADEIHIIASFSSESVTKTVGITVESQIDPKYLNAFLILGGTKINPLNHSVVNIGRCLENQIVIDDPRVSLTHAQLRVANACFIIFDLNSAGGTFVNGQRINKSILYPGDVIPLAGVTLIFGQNQPTGWSAEMKKSPR